jgi:hypothetical protein
MYVPALIRGAAVRAYASARVNGRNAGALDLNLPALLYFTQNLEGEKNHFKAFHACMYVCMYIYIYTDR